MTDQRSFKEIMAAHPGPWGHGVLPGSRNGMALIQVNDAAGRVVELMTILRIAMIASTAGAHAAPQPTTSVPTSVPT